MYTILQLVAIKRTDLIFRSLSLSAFQSPYFLFYPSEALMRMIWRASLPPAIVNDSLRNARRGEHLVIALQPIRLRTIIRLAKNESREHDYYARHAYLKTWQRLYKACLRRRTTMKLPTNILFVFRENRTRPRKFSSQNFS